MNTDSNQGGTINPCPPGNNVIILPPGEVSFIAIGLGLAVAFGFVVGALFTARALARAKSREV